MEWFKHSTGSHDDPDISDAWDKFGDSGIVVFWVMLEIYGQEFSHLTDAGELRVSRAFIRRKMRRSWAAVLPKLCHYRERGRILFREDGDFVYIKIPKFIKLASTWTIRAKDKPTEVPAEMPNEAPDAKNRIEEDKKKNKKKKETYSEGFLEFWNLYPKKVGKDAAWKAWKNNECEMLIIDLLKSQLERQINSEQWQKDNGQFIPHPATYINQGRWKDEVEVKEKSKWFNSNS